MKSDDVEAATFVHGDSKNNEEDDTTIAKGQETVLFIDPTNPNSFTGELMTAIEMASLTFRGEQEFRSKVSIEVAHNIEAELAHLTKLLKSVSVQGGSCFTYNHPQWTEWLKRGPELPEGENHEGSLARRRTNLREHMILDSLKNRLIFEGYSCNITSPYGPEDKEYLYVRWDKPKPPMARETCWRTIKYTMKFLILFSIISSFLTAFVALVCFTGWLLYTRWEKLELM